MNYIKQINGFWNWREFNSLSHGASDLYFAILHMANMAKWAKWIKISNSRLNNLTGFTDNSSLIKARNTLIQKKLIEYKKGTTRNAGEYKILQLYSNNEYPDSDTNVDTNSDTNYQKKPVLDTNLDTNTDTNLDTNTDTNLDTNLDTINKHKQKQKRKQKQNAAAVADEEAAALIGVYQKNIAPIVPIVADDIADWLSKVDGEVIEWAIGEAVRHKVLNWKYVTAILNNHFRAGRTTMAQITAATRAYKVNPYELSVYEDNSDFDYDSVERIMQEKYDNV